MLIGVAHIRIVRGRFAGQLVRGRTLGTSLGSGLTRLVLGSAPVNVCREHRAAPVTASPGQRVCHGLPRVAEHPCG